MILDCNPHTGKEQKRGLTNIPRSGVSSIYTWYHPFSTPVQANIPRDSTEYYWPMDDSTPDTEVVNYAGAKALTKQLGGTLSAVTTFEFNESNKAVLQDGVSCYSGAVLDAAIGTQDFYAEFDCSFKEDKIYHGIFAIGDSTAGVDFAHQGQDFYLFMYKNGDPAGNNRVLRWRPMTNDVWADGARHRFRVQVDRSNDLNSFLIIDDVAINAASHNVDDYDGVSISGGAKDTTLVVGGRINNGHPLRGEISQFKLVFGDYGSGSTTAAFDTGVKPTVGDDVVFTRTTYQHGNSEFYNNTETENFRAQKTNPAYNRLDSTKDSERGLSLEAGATNWGLYSRKFDHAATWVASNITVTTQQTQGIDDCKQAEKLVSTAANGTLTQTTAKATAGEEVCVSVWLKADAGTFDSTDVILEVEDSVAGAEQVTGLLDAQTGLSITAGNSNQIGTDWKQCYIFVSFTGGAAGNIRYRIKMITDALTIYADCAECKIQTTYDSKKTPSSFVYTYHVATTRNLTSVSIPTTAITNVNKFSWSGMFQMNHPDGQVTSEALHFFSVVTNIGNFWWYQNNAASYKFAYLGSIAANWYNPSYTCGQWVNIGGSVDTVADEYTFAVDGAIEYTGTVAKGAIGAITGIWLGSRDGATNICSEANAAELRIYDGLALNDAQFASEYLDMKTNLGI
ncbi:MAG: hypothetical protein GY861_08365 [bacterium]|nr:hypothetical protein [bacterium]